MSRRTERVCAAALLIAVAGCSASSFLLSWAGSGGKRQVVSGSINEVAARLQASLGKLNIVVALSPMDDGSIKLRGQSKSGKVFTLVLKRQMTSQGESTAISVDWEKDADEEFWGIVVDLLVKPDQAATSATAATAGANSGR